MKTYEFNEFLEKNHINVFTFNDAVRILGKPRHYVSIFLYRNKSISKVQNGLYYNKNASEYEIASNIVYPSYISLISGLRFYNLTEQIPNIIYVITSKRHINIGNLNGYEIKFITIKKTMMFGYEKIDNAFVASPEKAVLDMLYLGMFKEYANEIIESGNIDKKKFIKYAEKTKINTLITKAKAIVSKKFEYGVINA